MNTKGNCGTILCRAESVGPRGQYDGLLVASGEGSLFLRQATDKIHQRWLNSGPLVSWGEFDLHPLKWSADEWLSDRKYGPFRHYLVAIFWTDSQAYSSPPRGFSFTSTTTFMKKRRKKGIKHQMLPSPLFSVNTCREIVLNIAISEHVDAHSNSEESKSTETS